MPSAGTIWQFSSHIGAKATHLKGATPTNRRGFVVEVISKRHLDSTYESETSVLEIGGREIARRSRIGSWKKYLPLVEFVYNNNYHSSIRMALYEALYGGNAGLLCARKKLVRELWQIAASRQKSYVGLHKKEVVFQVEDKVLLKVSLINGVVQFEKKDQLAPRKLKAQELIEVSLPTLSLSNSREKEAAEESLESSFQALELQETISKNEGAMAMVAKLFGSNFTDKRRPKTSRVGMATGRIEGRDCSPHPQPIDNQGQSRNFTVK
ncbi:uncharacterized protein LOC131176418 [Hevea brasiliensis]|uniref:uncharacterized protein LOC131176418 n=1 Tax=Hevea brasiliensis TaxID=3981 RepID=UPI0025DD31BB|nr:uncharacterized protein LOC131176418 [Hevea brasiliensis]